MPGFDETGPRGAGPMTGGGRGVCPGGAAERRPLVGRGIGRGAPPEGRRGFGRGGGRGNGRRRWNPEGSGAGRKGGWRAGPLRPAGV